ncbi:MAG TPA: hypothetical protein VFX28_19540 [Methylomirabilota bacterium]|nr:hypothetical protein [Methylomirabilota bacterium]
MAESPKAAVEYARRLYDNVLGWYHSADTKAHVILGVDGAFLAFLTAAAFRKPEELAAVLATFSPLTWALLGAMSLSLVGSMLAAVFCLWSRVHSASSIRATVEAAAARARPPAHYGPGALWFFQRVAALEPAKLLETLRGVDAELELEIMAGEAQALSGRVRTKHIAVNVGFVLAVTTFLLFLLGAVSYIAVVEGG